MVGTHEESLRDLKDIRRMMDRGSRFISLSGLSGIGAGICALAGAALAQMRLTNYSSSSLRYDAIVPRANFGENQYNLEADLFKIAIGTFIAAVIVAFFFTYLRSRKTGIPIWGKSARRVMLNVLVPMIAGGVTILRLMSIGWWGAVAPVCLVFYGLGLINAGKYTFAEIGYLGYAELALGLIGLWFPGQGLLLWTLGFGVLHIFYGFLMWWKNERKGEVLS